MGMSDHVGATHEFVHSSRTEEIDTCVVRELLLVNGCTIAERSGAIVDVVTVVHQANTAHPGPVLFGALSVRSITGIQSETSGDVEETPISDRVFVIVAIQHAVGLPAETATTRVVDLVLLDVVDCLSQSKILRLVGRWVGEAQLSCCHCGHGPESLICQ